MNKIAIWIVCPLWGALVFWGEDLLVTHFEEGWSTTAWITAKTVALPVTCGTAFWHLVKATSSQQRLMSAAMAMVAGIWIGGPLYYILLRVTSEGTPMSAGEMFFHTILFPLSTPLMALYNGSFGGLLITSAALGVLGTGWLGVPAKRERKG
ncbi:hypothetical protein [Geobacter sp.]|uniref:hypothetical protein n=1 Tax=Geobacter sp. TaxID=46610 RepID=UPI0026298CDD|nr:hypothetical protein [Geobacter sp.]